MKTLQFNLSRFSTFSLFFLLCVLIAISLLCCNSNSSYNPNKVDSAQNNRGIIYSEENKKKANDFFNEAKAYGKKGEYDKAIRYYTLALECYPEFADVYLFRAFTYIHTGHFQEGIKDIGEAIRIEPTIENYRYRADNYAKNEYYDEAIMDYNMVLKLDPTNPDIYNNRATAYEGLNNYNAALSDYNKAISLNPNEPLYWFQRSVLKARLGDYSAAMHDAEKAFVLSGAKDVLNLKPGDWRESSEIEFKILELISDLEKVGAQRSIK